MATFKITYTIDSIEADNHREAAETTLDVITNSPLKVFEVTNEETGETKKVDLNNYMFEANGKMNNVKNSEINTLLEKIYHEIDIECISETDTVKMESVKNVLAKYGARPSEME